MRRGFTLIVAVMFLLLISTLTALALNFAMTTMRQTSELYLREQAELLAQGATEYAMLEIFNHDFNSVASTATRVVNNSCLVNINGTYNNLFNYEVRISYFGTIGNCTGTAIQTPQSAGTVQMDVFVTSIANRTPNPIRFHKRTLQKL